jgi:hypothetical protein
VHPVGQRVSLLIAGTGIIGGLSGCYGISLLGISSGQSTQVTPAIMASATPSAVPAYETCGWQWATQDQPDVTRQLSASLERAGIVATSVHAYAFGENCFNAHGEIQYFATRETDFDLTLPVATLADRESVGNLAADVLAVLVRDFAPGATPGPMPGRITLMFSDGSGEARLVVQQDEAADSVARGLRGSALLDELGF